MVSLTITNSLFEDWKKPWHPPSGLLL